MKLIIAVLTGIFFANLSVAEVLSEDCDCGHNPYVKYELNLELELDENPWRVTKVERFDIDLTEEEEPEVCVAYLELIPHTEAILYQDIPKVQEQELYWGDRWIPMFEFENQMDESGCSFEGAMS